MSDLRRHQSSYGIPVTAAIHQIDVGLDLVSRWQTGRQSRPRLVMQLAVGKQRSRRDTPQLDLTPLWQAPPERGRETVVAPHLLDPCTDTCELEDL